MKTKRLIPLLGFTAGSILFSLIVPAHAAVLGTIFSDGAVAPSEDGPWLTLTTTDTGTPNEVRIEFEATNLTGTEYVSELLFNLNPLLDPSKLSFSVPTAIGEFGLVIVAKEANAYKADGDGWFDIRLSFENSGGSDLTERFTQGDKVTYTVSYDGEDVITPESFAYNSQFGGGATAYLAAAHINATPDGGEGSTWVGAVPEPSPAILTLVATGMCLVFYRKRHHPRS